MNSPFRRTVGIAVGALVLAMTASLLTAQEPVRDRTTERTVVTEREVTRERVVVEDRPRDSWMTVIAEDLWIAHNGEKPRSKAQPIELTDWVKPLPVAFTIDYALATDNIWRGVNFTEYSGEGREKLNHQLGVGLEVDTRLAGIFGATIWFNWFAGLSSQIGRDSGNPQEVNYTGYWRIPIRSIGLMVEAGWTAIHWPENTGPRRTYEIYGRVAWDDGMIWRSLGYDVQGSFLNPYAFYAIDYKLADWGSWLEVGLKPRWVLADLRGAREIPVIRNMFISPSVSVGGDHRYLGDLVSVPPPHETGARSTRLANIVYALEVGYDFGAAFNVPKHYGTVVMSGFLAFSQALGRSDIINDELWGGVKVGYAW